MTTTPTDIHDPSIEDLLSDEPAEPGILAAIRRFLGDPRRVHGDEAPARTPDVDSGRTEER